MPSLPDITGTVTILADGAAELSGEVEITDDLFEIDISLTDRAGIASAQRSKRLGVRIDIETGPGTGVMVTLPTHTDVGSSLVIEESTEHFGDTCTFTLLGAKYSPEERALIRSRVQVDVYFKWGAPGAEVQEKVFTGWIVTAPFGGPPWQAQVTALDAAALHARKRANEYSLGANHGKSRLQITTELLAIGGIPIRSLDFPNGDGGTPSKPVAPGPRYIIEYMRDFLAVIGVEIGFIDGGFVAYRWDASYPAVLEVNPSNIIPPLELGYPDTLEANVVGVVAVSFTRTEPSGIRTVETLVENFAEYAPAEWVQMHSIGDGMVDNLVVPAAAAYQRVGEVRTLVSYFGSLDVRTEETTSGFYAAHATPAQLNSDGAGGYVEEASEWNWYTYADGSTRAVPKETFSRTRKTIRTKALDGNRNVIGTREERYSFHWYRRALFQVDEDGNDVYIGNTLGTQPYVNDEGLVVVHRAEVMGLLQSDAGALLEGQTPTIYSDTGPFLARYLSPDELVETTITLNDDETISQEVVTERSHDIGAARRRAPGAFGYGTEQRAYTSEMEELPAVGAGPHGIRVTRKVYRALDEDRYAWTQFVSVNGAPEQPDGDGIVFGALPRPERANSDTSGQEIRSEVADGLRIAFAGGEQIVDVEHNEFIETSDEADAYAAHLARKRSAVRLTHDMPIEGLIHKWKPVTANVREIALAGKFYVTSVRRDAATFRQTITAEAYRLP